MIDYILGYWQLSQPPSCLPSHEVKVSNSLVTCFAPILICRCFQFIYIRKDVFITLNIGNSLDLRSCESGTGDRDQINMINICCHLNYQIYVSYKLQCCRARVLKLFTPSLWSTLKNHFINYLVNPLIINLNICISLPAQQRMSPPDSFSPLVIRRALDQALLLLFLFPDQN